MHQPSSPMVCPLIGQQIANKTDVKPTLSSSESSSSCLSVIKTEKLEGQSWIGNRRRGSKEMSCAPIQCR